MDDWLDSQITSTDFVTRQQGPDPVRAPTPLLAYVDRARFPTLGPARVCRTRSVSPGYAKVTLPLTRPNLSAWEDDLQEWKKKYGADEPASATLMTMGDARSVRQTAVTSQTTDETPRKVCLEKKEDPASSEKTRVRDPGQSADVSTQLYRELRRVSINQMNDANIKTVQLVLSMSQKSALLQLLAEKNLADDERLAAVRQKLENAGTPPTPITPPDPDGKPPKPTSLSNKALINNVSVCPVEAPLNTAVCSQSSSSDADSTFLVETEHARKSFLIIPHDFHDSDNVQQRPEDTACDPLDCDRASTPLLACVDRTRFGDNLVPSQSACSQSHSQKSSKTVPEKCVDPYDWENALLRWKQKYGAGATCSATSSTPISYSRSLQEGGFSHQAQVRVGCSLMASPPHKTEVAFPCGDGRSSVLGEYPGLVGDVDKRLNKSIPCIEPRNTMHRIDTEEEECVVTEGKKRTAKDMAKVQQKVKTLAREMDSSCDATPADGGTSADPTNAPELAIGSPAQMEEEIEHQKARNQYWLKAPHNTMHSIDLEEQETVAAETSIRGARDIAEVQAKIVAIAAETTEERLCTEENDNVADGARATDAADGGDTGDDADTADDDTDDDGDDGDGAGKKTVPEPGPAAAVLDGTRLYNELRRVSHSQLMEADMETAQLALSRAQQDALLKLLSGGSVTDDGNLDAIRKKLEGGRLPPTLDSAKKPVALRPPTTQPGMNRLMTHPCEVPSNTAVGSRQYSFDDGTGVPESEVKDIGTSKIIFSGFRDTQGKQTEINAWMEQYDTRDSLEDAAENDDMKCHVESFQREGWVHKWPLHYAAMIGDVQSIHRLCVEGHDPNEKMLDWYDSEPLTWAAAHGKLAAVIVLCQCGADPQRPADKANKTPLTSAEENKQHHTAAFLREYARRVPQLQPLTLLQPQPQARAAHTKDTEPEAVDGGDLMTRASHRQQEEATVVRRRGGNASKKLVDLSTLGEREAEDALFTHRGACLRELPDASDSVVVGVSDDSEKMRDVSDALEVASRDERSFFEGAVGAADESININKNTTADAHRPVNDCTRDHACASNDTNAVIGPCTKIPSATCDVPSPSPASPSTTMRASNITTTMVRDFLHDIVCQRLKDKQAAKTATPWVDVASNPKTPTAVESTSWRHLAARARSVALHFTRVAHIITAMKCFASVRHPDTELYMLLLGELPPLIPACTPVELIHLLRLLARLRLRETTYVEMLCTALMAKTIKKDTRGSNQEPRNTFIVIPRRALIKCANAISELDVRGAMPRFVAYFLHYITSRLDMFDAAAMSEWSPLFVVHYCTNAARVAILERMAAVSAGFPPHSSGCDSPFDEEENERVDPGRALRNVALTVTVLRKEQHAFVSLLDAPIRHYFDKIDRACENDVLAGVTLTTSSSTRAQDCATLCRHVSSAAPEHSDWFSSALHRDVSACLTYLGILHSNGVVRGRYVCDIVATNMSNMRGSVIYECNSPESFYLGTFIYTAARRMRHSLMHKMATQAAGADECRVQLVDYFEWDALTQAQKLGFLLKIHGSAPNGCKSNEEEKRRLSEEIH